MGTTYLTKTLGTPTGTKKLTISLWVKRTALGASQILLNSDNDYFYFHSNDYLDFDMTIGRLATNRLFRDPSAWMHIVMAVDTTLGTADDRIKMYINGIQETSFQARTNPSQDATFADFNTAQEQTIGRRQTANDMFLDGVISHYHFIDGTAYAPSDFGETDSTTGEWKIKTSPSVTYGNNGFFILKDGNSVTDQSGNSNNWAVGAGTLTNTEDNPSNIFATWNPLISNTGATFTKGNTVVYRTSAGNYRRIGCTLGATSGKYYAEFLLGASQWGGVCLTDGGDIGRTQAGSNGYMGEYSADKSVGIRNDGIVYSSGANVSSAQWNQGSMSTSDRLCLALDMDNKKLFLGKNGTWNVSSNPATNTGGISLTGDSYTFCGATSNADCMINAGNGYFGPTVISSEGTNASGIGKFEYDVPSGFTALSTKGLNE